MSKSITRSKKDNPSYKPMVYIVCQEQAALYAEMAAEQNYIPVVPYLMFPFLNPFDEQDKIFEKTAKKILLGKCQELWVCSDALSEEDEKMVNIAKMRRIPITRVKEETAMIKVYGKVDCVQCRFTKQWLMHNEIAFEEVDVENQVGAMDEVRALGYASLPVVVNGVEHWQGFNLDKLEGLLCVQK